MWPFHCDRKSSAQVAASGWERRAKRLLSRLERSSAALEKVRAEASSMLDEATVLASDANRHIADHQRVIDALNAELQVERTTVAAMVLHDQLMQERTKADIDVQVRRQVAFGGARGDQE